MKGLYKEPARVSSKGKPARLWVFNVNERSKLDDRQTSRKSAQLWLLRLILPGRWGRWFTAGMIFGSLFGTFIALQGLQASIGPALFFSIVLAYIIPIFHYITARSRAALIALSADFMVDPATSEYWLRRIDHKPRRWVAIILGISISLGIAHNWLLWEEAATITAVIQSPIAVLFILSTFAVWVVMTFVLSALVDNAMLFNRCSKYTKIDLLSTHQLTPYAAVSVSSTLAIIGAQAAFPALMFGGGANVLAMIPGLIATTGGMVLLFILPIWPVHQLLKDTKRQELERLNVRIQQLAPTSENDSPDLQALNPLLIYRREISAVSEWPFDVSVVARLGLYMIIPPLTWVGAALIENLVDAVL